MCWLCCCADCNSWSLWLLAVCLARPAPLPRLIVRQMFTLRLHMSPLTINIPPPSIYYNDRNDSLHLELLLCRPQQDVVYLHVRGAGQDVGDSGRDVAALQTLHAPLDGLRSVRIVGVHHWLELRLHQARRDGGQPDVGAEVPHLLPPSLQQTCHCELGCRVESGGGIGRDPVARHRADHDDLPVTDLVPGHGVDAQLSTQTQG